MTEQDWNILYSLAGINDNYYCNKMYIQYVSENFVLPYRHHSVLPLEKPVCKCCLANINEIYCQKHIKCIITIYVCVGKMRKSKVKHDGEHSKHWSLWLPAFARRKDCQEHYSVHKINRGWFQLQSSCIPFK